MRDRPDPLSLAGRLSALADAGLDPASQIEERARKQFLCLAREPEDARRHDWRQRLRRRPALFGVGAVLLTGTAVAATTPWAPTVGDPNIGHPTLAASEPPAAAMERLDVLRRPQSDADRGPRAQAMLKTLGSELVDGVRPTSVRLLGVSGSGSTLLFSAETAGPGENAQRDVICFVTTTDVDSTPNPTQGSAYGRVCGGERELAAGQMIGVWPLSDSKLRVTGLVPDGVQKVVIPLKAGEAVAAVSNNAFDVVMDGRVQDYEPAAVRMMDRHGSALPSE